MSLLIVSSSLNPQSRSRSLAEGAYQFAQREKIDASFIDLRSYPLPFCDGTVAFTHENVAKIQKMFLSASALLIATPIYNYDVSAVLKNCIELAGKALAGKIVGFLCSAGTEKSYMSIMSFVNSLIIDFRCLIIPKFVYATTQDFQDNTLAFCDDVAKRIEDLVHMAHKLEKAYK